MTELLETLFTYACENKIIYSHEENQQRQSIYRTLERAEEEITETLTPEKRPQFKNYIQDSRKAQGLELEAIFRAGLAIGLELSRL